MADVLSIFLLAAFLGFVVSAIVMAYSELRRSSVSSDDSYPFSAEKAPWIVTALSRSIPQLPVELQRIKRDVSRAGFYDPLAPTRLLAWRNLFVWSVVVASLAAILVVPSSAIRIMIIGISGAILCYGAPGLWLNGMGNQRAMTIVSVVPEILDIMAMCLAGGLTIEQALEHVADYSGNIGKEVNREFQLVREQARMSTAGAALQRMADRFDEVDLRSLAATVRHSERLGVDVRGAITALSNSIRHSFRSTAESRANSLSLKLLFPTIFCVTPPVFFVLVVPPILQLQDHFQRELLSPATEDFLYGSQTITVDQQD